MKTLKEFDDYKIWRNDRFWLAGDHVVDPRNYDTPLSKRLLAASEKVTKDYKLTESKGPNVNCAIMKVTGIGSHELMGCAVHYNTYRIRKSKGRARHARSWG